MVVNDGFKAATAQDTEVWIILLQLRLQLRLKASALVQPVHQTFEHGHDSGGFGSSLSLSLSHSFKTERALQGCRET